MKKTLTALLLSAAFGSAGLFAACPTNPSATPNLANGVNRRVAELTKRLDLDASQQASATTIFTDAANAAAAIGPELCTAHETLQADVHVAGNNSSKISADAGAVANLEGQLLGITSSAENSFWNTLNASQQGQAEKMRGGFGGFGPPMGRGGPWPGPRPGGPGSGEMGPGGPAGPDGAGPMHSR